MRTYLLVGGLVAVFGVMGLGFASCAGGGFDPYQMRAQGEAQQLYANASIQATQDAFEVRKVQLTANAAQAQEEIYAQIRATEGAAQATQQANIQAAMTATAQAQATAGAFSAQATQQALSFQATQQAQSVQATATAIMLAQQERELELKRQEYNNMVRAFLPYVILAAVAGVLVYWLFRLARVRHFKRGPFGEMGYLMDGDRLVVPDLANGPVVRVSGNQGVYLSPEDAARLKEWWLKVEAIRAAAVNSPRAAQNVLQMLSSPDMLPGGETAQNGAGQPTGQVEIVDAEFTEVGRWVDEVNGKLLDRPE